VVTTLAGIYRLKSGGVGSSDPDTDGGINWELIPTQAKVDAKADKATTNTETEVEGLLDDKAAISGQVFSGNISAPNLSGTNTGDQTKADIDALNVDADTVDGNHASAFADVGHNHDSRYYTKSEADSNFVDAPLGRISWVNANLSWEVLDFSELDNWNANPAASVSLTGRPRRLALSADSQDNVDRIISDVLTTHDSLGAFRITFKDVSYGGLYSGRKVGIGLREINTGDFIWGSTGNDAAIAYYIDPDYDYFSTTTSNDGTAEMISDIDWGSNHDITIEWDGTAARLRIDGVLQSSLSHSESADYRPSIEIEDDGDGDGDTIGVGEIIVEAL
jgi:hypothetical protein